MQMLYTGNEWIFANIDFVLMAIARISPTTPTKKPQAAIDGVVDSSILSPSATK
jgi:hypothetical protein